MSFYGSVYYQLIDAFNTIIMKNTGNNSNELLTETDASTELSIEAKGRTDALVFESGNRWINFEQVPPPKDDNNDNDDKKSFFKIYHGPTKELTQEEKIGLNDFNTVKDRRIYGIHKYENPDNTGVELDFGDTITTPVFYFDEAGHIRADNDSTNTLIPGVKTMNYILPKLPESDQKVKDLEALIGTRAYPTDITNSNWWGRDESICKGLEENIQTIKGHDFYLKDKMQQVYCDPSGEDLEYFFGDTTKESGGEYKNFPKYFGNIDNIISTWQSLLNGNVVVRNFITSNNEYADCYRETNGVISIPNISSALRIAEGAIKALANDIQSTSGSAISLANNAIGAMGKKSTGNKEEYFNEGNTIAQTLGINNNDECFYDSKHTVYSAISDIQTKNGQLWDRSNEASNRLTQIEHNYVNKTDYEEKIAELEAKIKILQGYHEEEIPEEEQEIIPEE